MTDATWVSSEFTMSLIEERNVQKIGSDVVMFSFSSIGWEELNTIVFDQT